MGVDNTECTAWSHLFHLSVEWIIGSADHIRHREFCETCDSNSRSTKVPGGEKLKSLMCANFKSVWNNFPGFPLPTEFAEVLPRLAVILIRSETNPMECKSERNLFMLCFSCKTLAKTLDFNIIFVEAQHVTFKGVRFHDNRCNKSVLLFEFQPLLPRKKTSIFT